MLHGSSGDHTLSSRGLEYGTSHFVKGKYVNWSKAGEESILEQEAGSK